MCSCVSFIILQEDVIMSKQQILFSLLMGLPVLADLTSCRWRALWLESSSHLPALSASQGYGLGSSSTVTPPGEYWILTFTYMQWHFTAGAELCIDLHLTPSRVEFTFTTYLNGTELVNAIQNLNYKGGNTRTGAGLKFVSDNFFNPASSRDVPKVWGTATILWFFIISSNRITLLVC